jgi:minor extracellular serine protease Vpr
MLRLCSLLVALVSLNLAFLARPVHAAPTVATTAGPTWSRMIVQLSGPPLANDPNLKTRDRFTRGHFRLDPMLAPAQGYAAALIRYQQAELRYLAAQGITLRVIRSFHLLYNGFAAFVRQDQITKLRALRNVSAVLPDRMNHVMDDRSINLISARQAWSTLGGPPQAGKGVYVAIVDTGIQTSNPCFSDKGMPNPQYPQRGDTSLTNNKVVVARAFGSYPGQSFSALDTQGHGTFVAAITACDYNTPTPLAGVNLSGVAPDAYLMSYNVYPAKDDQKGPEDAAMAAFEAALQDGADVVNFSSGFPTGAGDERLDAEVAEINSLAKAGLVTVVSAGNAGPTPLSISSPSTADSAISVGASTNDRNVSESIAVGGPTPAPTSLTRMRAVQGDVPFTATVGPAQVVYAGYGRRPGNDSDHPTADDFTGLDLHGKIALIQRGQLTTFENKINNAASAGAIGAIIFDNRAEIDYPVMEMKTATLPAMFINQSDGQALLAWLKAHPDATLTMDPQKTTKNETPDILSSFSSRGYGPNYRIKPDLVAPGQDIYSAAQSQTPGGDLYDPSGFAAADGTSFSAPHVAGAVALLLQRHPTWTPALVKAALMETSTIDKLTQEGNSTPSVMDVGAGLVDVQNAVNATAYLSPYSASVGQANVGYGDQKQTVTLTLHDLGGGSGNWSASIDQLHGANGVSASVPASVQLTASGQATVALTLTESASAAPGDYDGYVVLQRGDQQLHVPYFVHVASKAVQQGSILLVDDTTTRFQPEAPTAPIAHLDVSQYYVKALQALGKSYTYWDDAAQGAPSLADMKRASAVIYFTGANLNNFAHENSNPQALMGPLSTIDLSSLHSYLDQGGRVFISGMGAALSDEYWDAFVMGTAVTGLSEYDTSINDKSSLGGKAPPKPSAVVEKRTTSGKPREPENPWLFTGLKPIDFSTGGDGAKDNVAIVNQALTQVIGVSDFEPFTQKDSFYGQAFGKALLRTTDLKNTDGNGDVAIQNSDEPSLKRAASYKGRAILFGFGFEGINNNTGYATREQVLARILQWFDDQPVARALPGPYAARHPVTLRSSLRALNGVHAVQYQWQIGGKTLNPSAKPTQYTFPHPGRYKIRVQVTDSLGHVSVSPWTTITAR